MLVHDLLVELGQHSSLLIGASLPLLYFVVPLFDLLALQLHEPLVLLHLLLLLLGHFVEFWLSGIKYLFVQVYFLSEALQLVVKL